MDDEKSMISKEKSAMYPAYTVKEILEEFIKAIDSLGGKKVSVDLVAKTIGVSSATKSFTRKLSSAKQYNLIELSNKVIELTELAKKILYPTTDNTNQLKIEAFKSPNVYSKLIERYNDKALPNGNVLANILLEPDYGITRNVKDLVVEKFLENCEDLNIIKNGILDINDDIEKESNISKETEIKETKNTEQISISSQKEEYQEMSIPLMGKKAAIKILIPNDCNMQDYEFLKKYVEVVLPMYIEEMKNKNQA